MNEIEFIESMKVLEIKPGDLLVFKVSGKLSDKAYFQLKDHIKTVMKGVNFLLLEDGMDIGVIRQGKTPEEERSEKIDHTNWGQLR